MSCTPFCGYYLLLLDWYRTEEYTCHLIFTVILCFSSEHLEIGKCYIVTSDIIRTTIFFLYLMVGAFQKYFLKSYAYAHNYLLPTFYLRLDFNLFNICALHCDHRTDLTPLSPIEIEHEWTLQELLHQQL